MQYCKMESGISSHFSKPDQKHTGKKKKDRKLDMRPGSAWTEGCMCNSWGLVLNILKEFHNGDNIYWKQVLLCFFMCCIHVKLALQVQPQFKHTALTRIPGRNISPLRARASKHMAPRLFGIMTASFSVGVLDLSVGSHSYKTVIDLG